MRYFICQWICLVCLVSGCTTQAVSESTETQTVLQIAGVEIHNGLPYVVHDVNILVPSTGGFVSCGQILPATSCSTSFPLREYRGDKARITWIEQGEPQSTPDFSLEPPADAVAGQSAYIRVEVFARGQAGARLVLLPLN